jgi:hypothetical protein
MSAFDCGFNRSMQQLVEIFRPGRTDAPVIMSASDPKQTLEMRRRGDLSVSLLETPTLHKLDRE